MADTDRAETPSMHLECYYLAFIVGCLSSPARISLLRVVHLDVVDGEIFLFAATLVAIAVRQSARH